MGACDELGLTDSELRVLELLTEATNEFADLDEHHPSDMREWAADIHRLQYRVMARAAIRHHPDLFTPMESS